ncbi:MAG: 3-phosphoshikimate 1-carboxyvinyltransferase [Armatimonadetes bacterium]|nr:3-phosphoshikimate 1-carboxyvinyltransferase [Armatimonadota bacterium]
MEITITPRKRWTGRIAVPGDKSISHRAAILAALAEGDSLIENFLDSADTNATVRCLEALGVEIRRMDEETLLVVGRGLDGLRESQEVLHCGNSGTTLRLLTGLLAGFNFFSVLTGDASLRSRPLGRVIEPLKKMGAKLMARHDNELAPVAVQGGKLKALKYKLPIPSAQVKSAILLAALRHGHGTEITETIPSRDHTERMLAAMGMKLTIADGKITLDGGNKLEALRARIPGDISSASYLMAAAAIVPGSKLEIPSVCVNPTRTGFFNLLKRMGANVKIESKKNADLGEDVGDILCETESLTGINVNPEQVPAAIDELPLLAVVATQAYGWTRVTGAEELRVKESDRIAGVVEGLQKMGARIEEKPGGFAVEGPSPLQGARLDCKGDHRLAMAFAVAAQVAKGETVLEGAEAVDVSYPNFWSVFAPASTLV